MRAVLILVAVFSTLAMAASSAVAKPVNHQDEVYLEKSHQMNLTEIFAGNLGQNKGECPQVRQLATMFIAHHLELDNEVIRISAQHGLTLASTPSPEQIAAISDLAGRFGRDFDNAWLTFQITTHIEALRLNDEEIRQGQAPDVKQLAVRTVPILQQHLAKATAARETCPGRQSDA